MRAWVERFRSGWRQVISRLQTRHRVDDQAENECLDQIWRAEYDEMMAILERKNPGWDQR